MEKKSSKKIIVALIIIISLVCLYLIAYHQLMVNDKEYKYSISKENFEDINNKYQDNLEWSIVEKTFTAKYSDLNKILIVFNVIDDDLETNESIDIKLENLSDNTVVKEEKIPFNTIKENNEFYFNFSKQRDTKDTQYKLTINFNNLSKAVNINYNEENLQKDATISINNEEIEGTLAINECYFATSRVLKFNLIALGLSVLIIGLSLFIYTRKSITPEKLFLYTVPFMCLLFLVIMPMYRGHDENRHMLRIYEISEGHLLTEVHDNVVGTPLPKVVIDGTGKYWREEMTYNDILDLKDTKIDYSDKKITNMDTVAIYSPIQYIPQAIGMVFSRLISDNLLLMLYVSRLFNLIVCAILLYLSIKLIPFGKLLVYLIAILPLSIEAFSTMSPDGITISLSILLIAYILNIIFKKDKVVQKKDVIIISIMSVIIALCKIVYVPLVAAILLIPSSKFKSKKSKILISTLIIGISVIANLIWFKISTNYLAIISGGSSTDKIINVLTSPISYLRMLLYTINYNGSTYMERLFGSVLAMGEFVKLYFIVPFIFSMFFLFESATNKELKKRFSKFQNIVIFLIILIVIGLVFTSLYVQFTDETSMTISGVQGRYFIPILLLIGLLLGNLKIYNDYDEKNKMKLYGIVALVLQLYIMLAIIVVHI